MRLSKVIIAVGCLLTLSAGVVFANTTNPEAARPFGQQIGKFKQASPFRESVLDHDETVVDSKTHTVPVSSEEVEYQAANGARFSIDLINYQQEEDAYEFLSLFAKRARENQPNLEMGSGYGTAGFAFNNEVAFFKGTYFVRIKGLKAADAESLELLAREISDRLDKGDGEIPVLVKHLPNAEDAQKTAVFMRDFYHLGELRQALPGTREIWGGADAVVGTYGPTRVLIIEYDTPQLAFENDQRTTAFVNELWRLGQPAPSAYRRVGNYLVFVFDAPDEQTARSLLEQVKYEQVVQWLGENPNIYKEAEKRYINTTLGVLIAVMKASGYALIGCLGMGALLGGLLFTYRRAQQKNVTAFSDAGGMLRLNLDELTAETNPSRLLRDGN